MYWYTERYLPNPGCTKALILAAEALGVIEYRGQDVTHYKVWQIRMNANADYYDTWKPD